MEIKDQEYADELKHFGILGMKWGKRSARGAGVGITKKRQLAFNKRALKKLDEGKHLSIGITKKRQEVFDKRDRKYLEKEIGKLEDSMTYGKNANESKNEKIIKNINKLEKELNNKRGARGVGVGITKKRQLAFNKRALNKLDEGKHLSIGITKKRQEVFDKRDRKYLEKAIGKLEDSMTYGKNANPKKNAKLDKEMKRLEKLINKG
jgi:Fe-S cluster biosynthesis and repair protein YggX